MMDAQNIISKKEWLRVIVLLVGVKLVILSVFAYSHHYLPRARYDADIWMTRPGTSLFQNLANFDGAWFIRLSAIGYQRLTAGDYDLVSEDQRLHVMDQLGYQDGIERKYAYRHWPLYPWLIKASSKALGHRFLLAGVLLSSLFYFLYGCFFYRLARTEFPEPTALLALSFALIHPGAYSLNALFNEPLFLFCAAASLYYLRKDSFFLCGLFGGLASMTRIEAVVLYVPIIYEYFRKSGAEGGGLLAPFAIKNIRAGLARLFQEPRVLWLFLAPLGSLAVLMYFRAISGDAFIFVQVHEANSYGHFGFPWQMLYATWLKGPDTYLKELPLHALLLLAIVFSFRKINWTWWVWAAAFWLFYTTNGNHSYLRYQVMCIPLFLMLAKIFENRPGLRYAYYTASAAGMAFFGAMFINGYWVA
jgi:hypothetical protein